MARYGNMPAALWRWSTRSWLQLTGVWSSAQTSCPQDAHACAMLLAYMGGYRLLAVALAGVCGWLLFSMVCRQMPSQSRNWALLALLFWLWNPLLLVSTAMGAHNDMLMLALQLAGLWLLQRRRWLGGLLVLVLAAHVKLTVMVLAPVVGLWVVRQLGWRRALLYWLSWSCAGLLISWLLYAPLGGWETLPRMLSERARYVANSFHHVPTACSASAACPSRRSTG